MTARRRDVTAWSCACLRCGHRWTSIGQRPPVACANCKSRSWNVKPGSVKLGRPPKD